MTKARIEELAQKALAAGNPYKKVATRFFLGQETRYLAWGEVKTEKELDEDYLVSARHEIEQGYKERMVGYYDKWHRYTRADEGRAYDLGVKEAVNDPKCSEEFHIIECMH